MSNRFVLYIWISNQPQLIFGDPGQITKDTPNISCQIYFFFHAYFVKYLSYSDRGRRLRGELDEAAQERWCSLRDITSPDD